MPAQIKDSGITWHPNRGTVLICDFSGNIEPEMCKKRPVVIITRKLAYRDGLAMIVPLSTTPPKFDVNYVVRLSKNYLDPMGQPQYAKCDLVCSVSWKRLDRIKTGFRQYVAPKVSDSDFQAIIQGVKYALDFEL